MIWVYVYVHLQSVLFFHKYCLVWISMSCLLCLYDRTLICIINLLFWTPPTFFQMVDQTLVKTMRQWWNVFPLPKQTDEKWIKILFIFVASHHAFYHRRMPVMCLLAIPFFFILQTIQLSDPKLGCMLSGDASFFFLFLLSGWLEYNYRIQPSWILHSNAFQ